MLITHEEGKIIPAPVIRDVWDCLPKRPKKPLVFRKKSTTENQYQERTNQKIIQQIREELTRSATLSLDVRDALVQEFPLTETNEVARRLLLWTIVGKQKKDAEGNVLLFDEPMSQVLGCAPRKGNKGDVYRWFRDTVNPNFRFSDYHHQAHKCRVMQCSGTEHLKMSFLYTNRKNQVRFYRDSLRKVTKASSEARVRKIKKMALSLRFPLADQQLIADYMHSLSSHTFDVSDEVYAAAFTQAVEEHNEHWLTCLQDFVDDSTPIYFPSQNTRRHRGKTPRLF